MQAVRHVSSQFVLSGAYGRVYKTKKDALRDWELGKDFRIVGGPYCSVRDIELLTEQSSGVYIATQQGHARVA